MNFQSGSILHSLFITTLPHTTDITRALILNLISHLRRLKTSVFSGENSHLHLLDNELPCSLSIRPKFHNVSLELPPLPSGPVFYLKIHMHREINKIICIIY